MHLFVEVKLSGIDPWLQLTKMWPPRHMILAFGGTLNTNTHTNHLGERSGSGRVLDSKSRVAGSSLTGITALFSKAVHINFNPGSLVPT